MRAIAVIAVILTHFQVSWLPGGFIGVDVFFVISGYLITGLLLREHQLNGKINFRAFYGRRIRRLFPAMLVASILTLIGGFLIFSDERFNLLLDSALATFFSVSNIYFWSQVGYFDTESLVKPLLHTWSLGVEEQFYLIWPLVMACILRSFRFSGVIIALLVLCTLSYILNALFMTYNIGDMLADGELLSGFLDGSSTAFYLMPFRVFQFGIGGLLVFIQPKLNKVGGLTSELITVGALVSLIFFMVELDGDSVFPYYNALIVSLLAALIIVFSSKAHFSSLILSNPLMVFIGGISYSLYLVHWPLTVYYQTLFGELTISSMVFLVLLMFVSAYALYILVEQRFRYVGNTRASGLNFRSILTNSSIPLALIAAVFFVFILRDIEDRVPEHRQVIGNAEWRQIERQRYCLDDIEGFPKDVFTCQNNRSSPHTVIVWGDSHALHLVAGISEAFPESNIAIAYQSGCISQSGYNDLIREFASKQQTEECVNRNRNFLNWAEKYEGELDIYISNAKRDSPVKIAEINNQHVQSLVKMGHQAYVIGDFIRPGKELAQCYSVPDYLFSDGMLHKRCGFDRRQVEKELEYTEKLASLSINYIPVHDIQCPDGECHFTDESGRVSYRDTHHLSVPGSIYWVSKVLGKRVF